MEGPEAGGAARIGSRPQAAVFNDRFARSVLPTVAITAWRKSCQPIAYGVHRANSFFVTWEKMA
jgi:hypothetical protein